MFYNAVLFQHFAKNVALKKGSWSMFHTMYFLEYFLNSYYINFY